jgi:UDP-2,3-diacylglucosamine hydrolase
MSRDSSNNSPRDSRILLISDLHLTEDSPELTQAFIDFLAREASTASALYILGDFFNVWLGDDDDRPLRDLISTTLRHYREQGLALYLLHGNRDFLLGEQFTQACGASLLQEPHVLTHQGQRYLLLHGDVLCTRDTDYQLFRTMVRNPQWQQAFLSKPLTERRAFAAQARAQSKSMNSNKAADIMDVTPSEVERLLTEHHLSTMIHGHTHRPNAHHFVHNNVSCQRIVLGDWEQQGWYISLTDTVALLSFAIAAP